MDANFETREFVRPDGTVSYDTESMKKKIHKVTVRLRYAYENAEESNEKTEHK